jgi:hypothetical protein
MTKLLMGLGLGLILLTSCEKNSTNTQTLPEISITVLETGCTDALLRIILSGEPGEDTLMIYRDNEVVVGKTVVAGTDTEIWDQDLKPNQNYTWQACWQSATGKKVSAQAATLDTMDFQFSWEIFEFGEKSGSYLNDVAIISENIIWAVGEIYTEDSYTYDSLGNWIQPYNAVHWDGNTWELKRIFFYGCPDGIHPSTYPIESIIAFSQNYIWYTEGGSFVHWNGEEYIHDCSINPLLWEINGSIKKLWGTSSENLYAVGDNGTIAHYDGENWQKIETGTDLPVQDIDGSNSEEGDLNIFICGSDNLSPAYDKQFFKIENAKARNIPIQVEGTFRPYGLWVASPYRVWLAGDSYAQYRSGDNWQKFDDGISAFVEDIEGNTVNDIYACGHFGLITHFNGLRWQSLGIPGLQNTVFYSIRTYDNLIVACGHNIENRKGVVAVINKI